MDAIRDKAKWIYHEFGIAAVRESGPDAWLIILSRSLRMLAYGINSLVIALFFSALNFTDLRIGLFMTLTLLGDVVLSFFTSLVADQVGRRRVLLGGAVLMVVAGAVFGIFENFWILLLAAIVGVISTTGGDFGPFRAIEESTLATLTTPKTRADVMAWYVTSSSVGSAIGSEAAGRILHYLQSRDGWTPVDAYHATFWVYTAMGILNIALTLLLSERCEMRQVADSTPLTPIQGNDTPDSTPAKTSRFAQISSATRSIMYKLWFLLVVDSLADGMVGYSLVVYYMDQKFDVKKSTLGDILSIGYVLSSCSSVFAGPLSRRLGLINTMVFTHLPSSAAVLLFPAPQGLFLTEVLWFTRIGLNNMDQGPRSTFISAVVKEEERTAVMGITSMLRTLAGSAGPTVTGILAGNDRFWIAFVIAGTLRIAYDLGLFAMFVNMKLYQHEPSIVGEDGDDERAANMHAQHAQYELAEADDSDDGDDFETRSPKKEQTAAQDL